jgi:hypothetical protein
MLRFMTAYVRGRANIVVSGRAGTGKTTMLGIWSASIPDDERLITRFESLAPGCDVGDPVPRWHEGPYLTVRSQTCDCSRECS